MFESRVFDGRVVKLRPQTWSSSQLQAPHPSTSECFTTSPSQLTAELARYLGIDANRSSYEQLDLLVRAAFQNEESQQSLLESITSDPSNFHRLASQYTQQMRS
jgi:hypothetical protein